MPIKIKALAELPGFAPFGQVSPRAVSLAERDLGISFSPDYREAAIAYGAIEVDGHELTSVVDIPRLDVVRVTRDFAALYPWLPKDSYVIEDAGIDGLAICQKSDGTVYQVSPDGRVAQIAKSLLDYLVFVTN